MFQPHPNRELILSDYLAGVPLRLICIRNDCDIATPGYIATSMGFPSRGQGIKTNTNVGYFKWRLQVRAHEFYRSEK